MFFGLAVISVIARVFIRLHTRRALAWDDAFLGLGVVCLSAATGIAYKECDNLFLSSALQQDPTEAFRLDSVTLNNLLDTSLPYLDAFLALAWTTIFAVKFSFLIFFKQLIRRLVKINVCFWIVTVFTALSWMFMVSEAFILCSYSGFETRKSGLSEPAFSNIPSSMLWAIQGHPLCRYDWLDYRLDALTDIMSRLPC